MTKKVDLPVMDLKMIPLNKIEANDYNPNKVAPPEMKLLKKSIEEDGYTMPIVVYYDKENDIYIVVDGFHRYRCAKKYFDLEKIPATIIDKPLEERMTSTIRHNRARGTHQIKSMSDLVLRLVNMGLPDEEIAEQLGMDFEEVLRLKQITGLKEAFSNHEFSQTWKEYEAKKNISSEEIKQL